VSNLVSIIRFINMFSAAITCGGLVMVGMAVYPAMKTFQPVITAQMHRAIDLLPDAYMRPSTITSTATALLLLVLRSHLTPTSTALTAVGLLGSLGVILDSEFGNVPINRIVRGWPYDYAPPEYPQILARWGIFHWVRTTCSLVALTCYLIAGLIE
jgi:uncharacterized membrane protein